MSRVFKSHVCVEANPCLLEVPDPEIFMMYQTEDEEPETVEAETETEIDSNAENGLAEPTPEEILETARQEAAKVRQEAEIVRREAELLLEKAKQEAEQIVAAANCESDAIKAEAEAAGRAAGNAAGYEAGVTQIRQEMTGKLAQALALLSTAELEHQRRILASEPEILKLAVAIATKIINAELNLAPEQRLEIVKHALNRFGQASRYKIRLNPDDLEKLTDNPLVELQSGFNEPKMVELIEDAMIAPTGCFIETDHGNIDVRLKSQMELIIGELLEIAKLE